MLGAAWRAISLCGWSTRALLEPNNNFCASCMAIPVLPKQVVEFDADFVRALRAGDAAAFARLVDAFESNVRRMAMTYFRSPFDQEEAFQEALLLLYRQREAIDPLRADELPSFVITLCRRRMIDLVRARNRVPPSQEVDEGDWIDEGPSAADVLATAELTLLLNAFEGKLKPSYRAFFHAVFVEGTDIGHAREMLGIGVLRARYLKRVLIGRLRHHRALLDYLGRNAD